jgi:magnesium transporter
VRVLTQLDRRELEALLAREEFFWLDLENVSESDVEQLGELFGFHPLALEDTEKFGQRPKLEKYDGYAFVVFYGARADEADPRVEVHLYVSGSYVVTVHREPCKELQALVQTIDGPPSRTEQFIVYRIFDTLTDSFFPLLSSIEDEIEDLEDQLIASPEREQMHRIVTLRRRLVLLRRVVGPQRDLFATATDELVSLPGLEADAHNYFRDVYDHLIRIAEQIDTSRDMLTGGMEVYLSNVSNRLNQIMKQLTVLATIFLPLTFVTGFFGQNFEWLANHIDSFTAFVVFGVGGTLVPVVVLLAWFRSRQYF